MTDLSFGNSGAGKLPKARLLPAGSKVAIAEVSVAVSQHKQKIQKGTNAGKEINRHQLCVIYQAIEPGTTTEGTPIKPGDRFVQYLGGVYPKDGGGVTVTKTGGAGAFCATLAAAGVKFGKVEDLAGYVVTIAHKPVNNPQTGTLTAQAIPSGVVGKADLPPPPATHAGPATVAVEARVNPLAARKTPPSDAQTAFGALDADDQQAILDSIKDGSALTERDLLEVQIAKDPDHAKAILATIPKGASA